MKPLINENMGTFIRGRASAFGERPALRFRGETLTYAQADRESDRIAMDLISRGCTGGTHIAIWSCNETESVLFFYALCKAGAVAVLINGRLRPSEVIALCDESDTDSILIGESQRSMLGRESMVRLLTGRKWDSVFWTGEKPAGMPGMSLSDMNSGSEAELDGRIEEASPEDDAMILFTSGTTGKIGKAVVYSSFHLVNGGIQKADCMGADSTDVFCAALPFYHVFGLDVNILAALAVGGCVAIPEDFHSASVLQTIQDEHCTVFSAVPSIYQTIVARSDLGTYDIGSLRVGVIGGAYSSPELFCEIENSLGFTLLSGLGQSEVSGGITISSVSDPVSVRSTTVGHFVPHLDWKIADVHSGKRLPCGETGEVCVRGRQVMKRYYHLVPNYPIDEEGWLHTGDLGMLDGAQNLHIKGRLREMICRGGEKILPGELENVLESFPEVAQAKVIGVPDAHYGEEICACLILKEGAELDPETVRERMRLRVARFKIPAHILFLKEFPMTGSGKVCLAELRKEAGTQLASA